MAGHIRVHRNAARAFTLLETLVSLGVFAIIMMTVGSIFFSMYRDWKRQKDYMNVLQDSYWAVEGISSEIRQATDITVQAGPSRLQLRTNYIPDIDYWFLWWHNIYPQFIWIWRGTHAGISNENDSFGYNGYLYWGRGAWLDFPTDENWGVGRGGWQYRNVLCRFVTNYTHAYDVAAGLVYLNLTLRPQPDAPEGPLNRNYTVNTVIRRRN